MKHYALKKTSLKRDDMVDFVSSSAATDEGDAVNILALEPWSNNGEKCKIKM